MTTERSQGRAASIRRRLLDISRAEGEDFQRTLSRYGVERFLYRLSKSEYARRFVLKGAALFAVWTGKPHRPTRDLDLLGFGPSGDEAIRDAFQSIGGVDVQDDGLEWSTGSLEIEPIREGREYEGARVTLGARLGRARIDLQVDVGFGDAVTPDPVEVVYPTLLGMDPPRLLAYPRETVVAEKLEAMVKLGLVNSRMKDLFDVAWLARSFGFSGGVLKNAIVATFERRRTTIARELPIALTATFAADPAKSAQWKAFVSRQGLEDVAGELGPLVEELARFLEPPLTAAAGNEAFEEIWRAGDGWQGP